MTNHVIGSSSVTAMIADIKAIVVQESSKEDIKRMLRETRRVSCGRLCGYTHNYKKRKHRN